MIDSHYITSIELLHNKIEDRNQYPFMLAAVQKLKKILFHSKVTYFVGENGTGKSTLLEAIAVHYGFNPEGGSKNFAFFTQDTHSDLHEYLRLAKGIKRPKDGYFFERKATTTLLLRLTA